MPLYLFNGSTFFEGDPYDTGSRRFTSGQIYELAADDPILNSDFEQIDDPRNRSTATTLEELAGQTAALKDWERQYGDWTVLVGVLSDRFEIRQLLSECLGRLIDAALDQGFTEELDVKALDQRKWKTAMNQLAAFAVADETATPDVDQGDDAANHELSADGRSLRWFGTTYEFTPTQAACVRVMYEAWKDGTPSLGQAYILERVDSNSGKLQDLFKDHGAWGTLIVPGKTKGAFRLAEPPT